MFLAFKITAQVEASQLQRKLNMKAALCLICVGLMRPVRAQWLKTHVNTLNAFNKAAEIPLEMTEGSR